MAAAHSAENIAHRLFTMAEIRRMVEAGIIAENENIELIDGELISKSSKGNQHEIIKAALVHFLAIRSRRAVGDRGGGIVVAV